MAEYIYIVGKGDAQLSAATAIRKAGYCLGLFLDARTVLKNQAPYDSVIPVDFENLKDELPRLLRLNLPVAGLLCTYENYVLAKAVLAEVLRAPGMSVESARRCTDKYLMRQAFTAYDPSITPQFQNITCLDDALTFATIYNYPVILKPTNLVKSLLVLRCNNEEELRKNFTYAQQNIKRLYARYRVFDHSPQLIIEQYVVGRSCSVAAFVDRRGQPHFCDGIVALTTAQDIGIEDNFLYSRSLPAPFDPELSKKIFAVARKGIRALGISSSPAHVELIYTDDGDVKLIEIGARIGGYRPRMYQVSYGVDMHRQEVAVAAGKQPSLQANFRAFSAVYELFPTREGRFQKIKSKTAAAFSTSDYLYYATKVRQATQIGPAKNGFKATAIIIVSDPTYAAFMRQRKSVESLSVVTEP